MAGGLAVASAALALAAPLMGVRRPRRRDLPLIALCGLAGVAVYQLLLNTGERIVPAGTAALLVATAPVYASLLAFGFLGERPGRRQWAGSAVALAGAALIALSHGLGFGAAALIVLAAAVAQAVFHTAQKPLLRRYTGFEVTAYAMWAGTLFVLPGTGSLLRVLPRVSDQGVVAAVFLGVAPSAAGFVLWAIALGGVVVANTRRHRGAAPIRPPAEAPEAPGPAMAAGSALGAGSSRPGRGSRTGHAMSLKAYKNVHSWILRTYDEGS